MIFGTPSIFEPIVLKPTEDSVRGLGELSRLGVRELLRAGVVQEPVERQALLASAHAVDRPPHLPRARLNGC